MPNLVIFGAGQIAELASFYFNKYTDYNICAHCADSNYLTDASLGGNPVVAFEEIEKEFPPSQYDCFVAMSYSSVNSSRRDKFSSVRALGYYLPSFVSPQACLLTEYPVGQNCFILELSLIHI